MAQPITLKKRHSRRSKGKLEKQIEKKDARGVPEMQWICHERLEVSKR